MSSSTLRQGSLSSATDGRLDEGAQRDLGLDRSGRGGGDRGGTGRNCGLEIGVADRRLDALI